MADLETYNDAVFPPLTEPGHFAGFPAVARVGAPTPGREVILLGDDAARLSAFQQDANLVRAYGSVT